MKKEWTFNYFGKAEPDKNKAHIPEKPCGLNLWNSFIRNSMLMKKNLDSHKKLIYVKNVANPFSIPFFKWYIFFCYLYWSLGAVFYMFGLLRVAISSIKLCFSIKKATFEKKIPSLKVSYSNNSILKKWVWFFLNFSTNYLLVLLIGNPSAIVARQPIF